MLEDDPEDQHSILLHLKVVPGSSRDAIGGALGARLKVKVAAAPEKGQANASVLRLIARRLDVPESKLTLIRGQTSPEKTLRIRGMSKESALRLLSD